MLPSAWSRLPQGKSKPRDQNQGSQGKEIKCIGKNDQDLCVFLRVCMCERVHVCEYVCVSVCVYERAR